MSWSSLHGRLASDWWAAEPQANASLAGHAHHGSMPMPLSGAAAVARFQDGQISTILVGREARDWEVNLLQGVLGHMQIQNGAGSNGLHGRGQQQQDQQGGVYRVLEVSGLGSAKLFGIGGSGVSHWEDALTYDVFSAFWTRMTRDLPLRH